MQSKGEHEREAKVGFLIIFLIDRKVFIQVTDKTTNGNCQTSYNMSQNDKADKYRVVKIKNEVEAMNTGGKGETSENGQKMDSLKFQVEIVAKRKSIQRVYTERVE